MRVGLAVAMLLAALGLGGCETARKADGEPSESAATESAAPESAAVEAAALGDGLSAPVDQPGTLAPPPKPTPVSRLSQLSDSITPAVPAPEIYRGSGVLARRITPRTLQVEVSEGGPITLNFVNAEIREVVDVILGDTLNVSYIIDPKVQGQVTARTSRPIPRRAVIPALENILALNGAAMVQSSGVYKVVTLQEAANTLSTPLVSPRDQELARGFGIHVLPVRYASADELLEIVKPFVGPGRVLRSDADRNLLIFSGNSSEAADLMDMVSVFDVDWMKGMSFAIFPAQVADAKSLADDLKTVFQEAIGSGQASVVKFVPIERLNSVLAISPQPAYLDQVQSWIDRLDRGAEGAGRRIFVYHVQNGRAADLADVLSQIFGGGAGSQLEPTRAALRPGSQPVVIGDGGATGAAGSRQQTAQQGQAGAAGQGTQAGAATPAQGGAAAQQTTSQETVARRDARSLGARSRTVASTAEFAIDAVAEGSDIRIIADETNNALVIMATASEYRMIEATLKRLDVIPLQVLIEVTIAEVSLENELRYGLQWFFQQGNHSATFSSLASGDVASAFPGFSYVFASNNARVVLNALTEITDVNVISSPQLLVLDNQSARLQVGDEVPIATQSAVSVTDTGAPVVNSIQFRDTGVILEVTPRVNASGLVVLDVLQEVSDVIATTTSDLDSPTIQQRSIESTVAVQSGQTVALGGLIRDNQTDGVSGIPILSEIPILGNLFKTTTKTDDRDELLVLITPRVVRDQHEAREVTEELRMRLKRIDDLEERIGKSPVPPASPLPPVPAY